MEITLLFFLFSGYKRYFLDLVRKEVPTKPYYAVLGDKHPHAVLGDKHPQAVSGDKHPHRNDTSGCVGR